MRLIIGCPIYDRAWMLPAWFGAIAKQSFPLEDIGFVFITSHFDPDTISELIRFQQAHHEVAVFDIVENLSEPHDTHPEGHRIWTDDKYRKMVALRNQLLYQVRCHQPERFFSLDSDIILEAPDTIERLFNFTAIGSCAVSPLMYMTPDGVAFPSTMTWVDAPGGVAGRMIEAYPMGQIFQTDVIMAAKMMSKEVYENVDYTFHTQGEDLGWSTNVTKAGYNLFLDSSLYCPHLMSRAALAQYQRQGDPRKAISCLTPHPCP